MFKMSKMSEQEIIKKIDRNKIKEMYNNGVKQIDIAKHFKATKGAISNIIKDMKKQHLL